MAEQAYNGNFIERITRLLNLLEEKGLELDQLSDDNWPFGSPSDQEVRNIRATLESIRFMDEIPGGFFIYAAYGDEKLIYANQGVLRMFQCENLREFREYTGNSFKGMVLPEDYDAVERSIWKQIHEDQYELDYVEYRIRPKNGDVHWVEDYGHFVHAGKAGDVFYVFMGTPSEERDEQQTQQRRVLAEALERADMAVKAKNAFLSQMSHEMRTSLNAIFGFTTLAKNSLDDTKALAEYLDEVESASHKLLDMITQALDVSSMSSAAGVSQEECDLPEAMEEIYKFLLLQAKEKDIDFVVDYTHITHPGVYTDLKQLRQLIMNLANNALTYTPAGGRVTITLTEEKELPDHYSIYRLDVTDTGVGISEEFIEQVFEPFTREKTSTLSGVSGIGLGLTIAKNIVDLLKGTISVKTAVNEGSTFTVTLPFRVQPLAEDADLNAATKAPSLRILLAEDNEINREIETELLERMGFIVDPVADGKEAFEKVRAASPGDYDLAIIDLQMPLMDGWEVAAAIRKLPDPTVARLPIIALSANVRINDRRRSLESGIDVHLPKPMDLNVLLETIEKITKKSIS